MAVRFGNHHWMSLDTTDPEGPTHVCTQCYAEWRGNRKAKDGTKLGPSAAGGCGRFRVPPHDEWVTQRPDCVS